MADPSGKREEIETAMGGPEALTEFVLTRKGYGASWQRIAGDLRAEHQQFVSDEALRRWFGDAAKQAERAAS
jgi:hypothetical protein